MFATTVLQTKKKGDQLRENGVVIGGHVGACKYGDESAGRLELNAQWRSVRTDELRQRDMVLDRAERQHWQSSRALRMGMRMGGGEMGVTAGKMNMSGLG
ncbi:hypothetical protein PIB30_047717 [Stylosanthes scabra]|uniref:Uncharacterized protein n=1 Tax=Stylosanthes scabra TaxID=79078 RepID=A0ABU6UFP0_9FABA|nr:hypothetical protein [Stylosanthes scabra]